MKKQPQISAGKRNWFHAAGIRWLTLGFVLFLGLIFFWADRGSLPGPIVALYAFPQGDKVGHFVLYGLLSFLLCLGFPNLSLKIRGRSIPAGLLIALTVALVEEASQALFQTRTASLADLASGWLGALLFAWAAAAILSAQSARLSAPNLRRHP
jgi:hypothetical protein